MKNQNHKIMHKNKEFLVAEKKTQTINVVDENDQNEQSKLMLIRSI